MPALDLIWLRRDNIPVPHWHAMNRQEGWHEPYINFRVCDLVIDTNDRVFMPVYIDALTREFQPSLTGFFYNVFKISNIAPMQLQPSCWEHMATYFFDCKARELHASTAGHDDIVPANVFVAGLDARVFAAIHFLKAHEYSYTFDARPVYEGFLVHVTSSL